MSMETLGASIVLPRPLIRLRHTDKGSKVALMRVGGPVGDRENIVDGYFPKVVMIQNDGKHGFGAPCMSAAVPAEDALLLSPALFRPRLRHVPGQTTASHAGKHAKPWARTLVSNLLPNEPYPSLDLPTLPDTGFSSVRGHNCQASRH